MHYTPRHIRKCFGFKPNCNLVTKYTNHSTGIVIDIVPVRLNRALAIHATAYRLKLVRDQDTTFHVNYPPIQQELLI